MEKKEFLKKEYRQLTDFYAGYICTGRAIGYTMDQIADFLYDENEICYWQRDLLKKGVEGYYETITSNNN